MITVENKQLDTFIFETYKTLRNQNIYFDVYEAETIYKRHKDTRKITGRDDTLYFRLKDNNNKTIEYETVKDIVKLAFYETLNNNANIRRKIKAIEKEGIKDCIKF